MSFRVRLVSWNLHGTPGAPRREERLDAAAAWVGKQTERPGPAGPPDLVLLQEVWGQGDAGRIETALASAYRAVGTPEGWLFGRKGGLLALVRRASGWRVDRSEFLEFSREAPAWRLWEGDGFGDKGAQRIVLQHAKHGRLAVLNTHVQAQYGARTYADVRRAQLSELDRWGRELPADVPVLLGGDLNTEPDDPALAELRGAWEDLTAGLRARCGCGTTVAPGPDTGATPWIDYVMARRTPGWLAHTARASRIESARPDDPYSDHHGLDVTVALTRAHARREPQHDRRREVAGADAAALLALAGPSPRRAWLLGAAWLSVRALGGWPPRP